MSVIFYPNYINNVGYDKTAEPSITTQGYTCSGGETTGPAYDLLDGRRTTVITIDTNGEATDFTVDFDLSANITGADFCIVDNHNFLSASCYVILRYNVTSEVAPSAADSASGPLGSQMTALTLTGSPATVIVKPTDGCLLIRHSGQTENNWDLSILDWNSANFAADVTMGEVFLGVSCTPSISPNINPTKSYRYGSTYSAAQGGQKYGFKKYGVRRGWRLSWDYLSSTDKINIETVFAVTEGMRYPFYIDLGETSPPTLYLVRFNQESLEFQQKTVNAYGLTIDIEQEL